MNAMVWSGFFEPYDLLLIVVGLTLLIVAMGRSLLDRFNLNSSFLYIAAGLAAGPLWLGMAPADPLAWMPVLERVAELGVIVSLIVVGVRIGRPLTWRRWRSALRLVLIVMPATIIAVALSGYWLLGLALGPALLLGAVLAPTDPILAGPLEEHDLADESERRFGLSGEGGLNDGFAFPFVYLGLYATWQLPQWQSWLGQWLLRDLLYAVAVALPLGLLLGRLCGHVYVTRAHHHVVSRRRRYFTPLALLLAVYGLTEAIGGYGFLAAFTAGLGFRQRMDAEPGALEKFTNFTESVDELAKALALIMLAALLRWEDMLALGWPLLAFALLLILVLRPALTMAATAAAGLGWRDRLYWSWFGLRGIGSIYYLSYAINSGLDDALARTLFAATAGTILVSVLVHGLSLRPILRRFGDAATES